MFPEDVLEELAKDIPEALVEDTDDLVTLSIGGFIAIRVVVPPAAWPVRVKQYGADGSVTGFSLCGDGYNPNRPRFTDHPKLTADEWDEMQTQGAHTPIDSPEKLRDLLQELLKSEKTASLIAAVKARNERKGRKLAKKGKPVQDASGKTLLDKNGLRPL